MKKCYCVPESTTGISDSFLAYRARRSEERGMWPSLFSLLPVDSSSFYSRERGAAAILLHFSPCALTGIHDPLFWLADRYFSKFTTHFRSPFGLYVLFVRDIHCFKTTPGVGRIRYG